jgi:hypothetical protein
MRAKIGVLLLLAVLGLTACDELENVPTKTQVTLRVQAQDVLFATMTHVRVSVFRKDATWVMASTATLAKADVRWPLDIPIVPSSAHALDSEFEVIVEALASGSRLAQTRAVSGYALNSLRVLEVWLHTCTGHASFVCAEDACHGPDCTRCDSLGGCEAVGTTDPTLLPAFSSSESPISRPPPDMGGPPPEIDSVMDGGLVDAGRAVGINPQIDAATCDPRAEGGCEPASAVASCPVCPSPGYCARDMNGATCVCPAGWTLGATGCVAPAGCASVSCGAQGSCVMTGQTTSCSCNHGYVASGMDCVPVDECQTGTHTCAPGTCGNGAGLGYTCSCPTGYQATTDSFPSCVVSDECKLPADPCGANGTCAAGAGLGYSCNCKQGYVSNGQLFASCVLEDECMTASHGCSPGGTCSNGAALGYQCTCSQGYTNTGGSFPKCVVEDECATGTHGCSPGGTCANGAGLGYMCMCNQGYASSVGSFPKCNPVDECASGTHWCAPAAGSCTSGSAVGYDCQCPSGFVDSGGTFPQCYISGSVQGSLTTGVTFDFPSGQTSSCCTAGEFYISSMDVKFWANNVGQGGVVQVNVASSTPLLSVPVPTTGYTRFGVAVAQGSTYVSYAQDGEGSYYVIFRVTSLTSTTITLDFVYVYRP